MIRGMQLYDDKLNNLWQIWAMSFRRPGTPVMYVFSTRFRLTDTLSPTLSYTHVQVDGSPFHFAGFNNYYMPTYAADENLNERTQDVDVVFA